MSARKSNENFCGSLPLHLINQIQDYGVLIVVDKDETIIQVSANIGTLIGAEPAAVVGTPLAGMLSGTSHARVHSLFEGQKRGRRMVLMSFGSNPEQYPSIIHPGETFHIIEVELKPASQQSFISVYEEVKDALASIQECSTVQDVCDIALAELKRLSDFDRLMVYRFDEAWNGTVIAQVREDYMSDYLGLRFPASDVPQQARALYQTNPYRLIPNREYTPVRLHPVINPITSAFTDLSPCNLRSVAGVHLEYMRNMDTMASMSTRILIDGKLWGLISCHHRDAKTMNYEQSSVFELVSDGVASRIATLEAASRSSSGIELQQQLARFIERLYRSNDLAEVVADSDMCQMFGASGLIYARNYQMSTHGEVPPEEAIRQLLFWLDTRQAERIFATRALSVEFDEWQAYRNHACGMLSIPIPSEQQEYLILLRGEVLEEVNWGGNPDDALQMEPDGVSYHPRNSFSIYKEAVSGYSQPWSEMEIELAGNIRQAITEYFIRKF